MKKPFPVELIKTALMTVRPKISDPQMSMLRAHYYHRTLSMERIAHFGGYRQYRAGNSQYGRLGKWIGEQLGFDRGTYAIASGSGSSDENKHFQWRMDDSVVNALKGLNWFPPLSNRALDGGEAPSGKSATETEREALVQARIGQGGFRLDVISLWGCCSVTGCALESILVASHIVPWKDATNTERTDPLNGLLLTPNFDSLFDQFLISFNDDGSILLSKDLTAEERAILGVSDSSRLRFVRPAMLPYLRRHRQLFFLLSATEKT